MGTLAPWRPECCFNAASWWGHRWGPGRAEQGIITWSSDVTAYSATSSQNSLDGEGPGDPAQSTPSRAGCSRPKQNEV